MQKSLKHLDPINQTNAGPVGLFSTMQYAEGSAKCLCIFGLIVAALNGALGATHAFIIADLIEALNPH